MQLGWEDFDGGKTVGKEGSEHGVIMREQEHPSGARICLEQNCRSSPFAITCGIYGWLVHTRFFKSIELAESQYEEMKAELVTILENGPRSADTPREVFAATTKRIEQFVARFP